MQLIKVSVRLETEMCLTVVEVHTDVNERFERACLELNRNLPMDMAKKMRKLL